ncbi:MAG: RHS repeat domain-containing protein, partial [Porticoccaceae bacterium]
AGNAASIHTNYDPNGNPTTVVLDQDGRNLAIHRSYDDQNRLEREETVAPANAGAQMAIPQPYTHTQRYALDGNGNRVTVIDAANTTTQQTFDAQNRLLSSTTAGEGSTTTRWNKNGTLQSIDHGNGSTTRYQYDRAQRIQEITHTQNNATTLAFSYDYDQNGNRSQETRTQSAINGQAGSIQTTSYAYDRDDRLIQTTVSHQPSDTSTPDERSDWTLDAVGNRLTETVTRLADNTTTSNKSYIYSDRDQLTLMTDSINQLSVEYSYDQNGNRVSRTVTKQGQPPETTTYTFDARDRLTGVQPNAPNTANAPTIAYQYDADGRRIERIAFPATGQNPAATLYLYNGSSLLHEAIPDGAASSANASGLRLTDTYRTSVKLDRHLAFDLAGNASVRFYQLDALDTPVAMTDANGNTVTRTTFDAWGNIEQQIANGTVQTPWQLPNYNPDTTGQAALLTNDGQLIGFTGYQKDSDTGLYYAQARWYDPLAGGFTAMDPAFGRVESPITFNTYLYANANPLTFIDPDGRCSFALSEFECNEYDAQRFGIDNSTIAGAITLSRRRSAEAKAQLLAIVSVPLLVSGVAEAETIAGATLAATRAGGLRAGAVTLVTRGTAFFEGLVAGGVAVASGSQLPPTPLSVIGSEVNAAARLASPTLAATADDAFAAAGRASRNAGLEVPLPTPTTNTVVEMADGGVGVQLAQMPIVNPGRRVGLTVLPNGERFRDLSTGRFVAEGEVTAADVARGFQGSGAFPGVDKFRNGFVQPGQKLVGGLPGMSGFLTSESSFARVGDDATALFGGLQVGARKDKNTGITSFRNNVGIFEIISEQRAALGITRANPQFGPGGTFQVFLPDVQLEVDNMRRAAAITGNVVTDAEIQSVLEAKNVLRKIGNLKLSNFVVKQK